MNAFGVQQAHSLFGNCEGWDGRLALKVREKLIDVREERHSYTASEIALCTKDGRPRTTDAFITSRLA